MHSSRGSDVPGLGYSCSLTSRLTSLSRLDQAIALSLDVACVLIKPVLPDRLVNVVRNCLVSGSAKVGLHVANAETILLVEDEPAVRQLIAAALERAGYRVLQARTGREALGLFDVTVDLLLTDMRLPHLGGADLIQQLRAQRPTLKVISISGFTLTAPTSDDPFLVKPFTRDDLLHTVRAVLGDKPAP